MRKAYIIHGWEGYPEEGWYPWLRDKLILEGFETKVLEMPETETPTLNKWLSHLKKAVKNPDTETFLIGHSLGCITTLRFIESLEKDQKIAGAVLVAGFGHDLEYPGYQGEFKSFFVQKINWEKIKKHCQKFVAIHSDNDPWVPLKHNQIYQDNLGAESIIEHNRGHFSGGDGVKELPKALESVLKISS